MVAMLFAEPPTLRESLEQRRLAFRVERLERVVRALEERVRVHADGRTAPAALRLALSDFRQELAAARAQWFRTRGVPD
jgi:hypothetical protein